MKNMPISAKSLKTTGRHANDPVQDPIAQSINQESLYKQALRGFIDPGTQPVKYQGDAGDWIQKGSLSNNSDFFGYGYQRHSVPGIVDNSRNSFPNGSKSPSQIQSLQPLIRNASPYPREPNTPKSSQTILSNPLKIDISTNEKYSKSPIHHFKKQEISEQNQAQSFGIPIQNANAKRDASPTRHHSIFQTGRSYNVVEKSSGHKHKVFAELPADYSDTEQSFFGKTLGTFKNQPIAPINLSGIHATSPRNSLTNNTLDVPTITARKGGVKRSHLSQSVTMVPKVSKLSIFEDPATARHNEEKKGSIQNAQILMRNTPYSLPNQSLIAKAIDSKNDSNRHLLVLDRQRFVDGPIYPNQDESTNHNNSEFAPDVFQKLRIMESEILKLKADNDRKKLEIKALGTKPGGPQKSDGVYELLRQDNLRLQEDNIKMKARIAELEYLAFGKKSQAHPEIDLTSKVIELEQENREVKLRYDNLKKIASNATFQDLEKLMKKIQEMEAYIKSLKRKNELLEAQISS